MSLPRSNGHLLFAPLALWQKVALVLFAACIVGFACLVEYRSAFLERRRTDAGVYFRAAWAVRCGADLYHIADDNGWHYNYPPLLAILMTPLADAPHGEARDGLLPYPVSIALWFAINLFCGGVAVHWLACTLEEFSPNTAVRKIPWGCRQWWARRLVPALICLGPMAHTLMRGQVNLIVLLAIAGTLRALMRMQNLRAGIWLAAAICIKIIPAFLLLIPICRRDWRFLGGSAVGLFVGLALIPVGALGPSHALLCYQQLADGVLRPGLTHEGDPTRAKELTNVTGTGSQSLVVVWHNTLNPDRSTRPTQAAHWLRLMAMAIAACLLALTLAAASRGLRGARALSAVGLYLAWGALIVVMLIVSPVSHMHYQCLCLPLVMALWELNHLSRRSGWALVLPGSVFLMAHTLPHVPQFLELRDFGLPMYAAAAWWAAAVVVLWRLPAKLPSEHLTQNADLSPTREGIAA